MQVTLLIHFFTEGLDYVLKTLTLEINKLLVTVLALAKLNEIHWIKAQLGAVVSWIVDRLNYWDVNVAEVHNLD